MKFNGNNREIWSVMEIKMKHKQVWNKTVLFYSLHSMQMHVIDLFWGKSSCFFSLNSIIECDYHSENYLRIIMNLIIMAITMMNNTFAKVSQRRESNFTNPAGLIDEIKSFLSLLLKFYLKIIIFRFVQVLEVSPQD